MFNNTSCVAVECFRRLETLDEKRIFYWYRKYFYKLSELVSYLRHKGFDLFLIRGAVLSAYRDFGQYIHHYDLFTCFGIHEEKPWHQDDYYASHFFETICDFITDDSELEWYWPREFEVPTNKDPFVSNAQACADVGVFFFNVMLKEFPKFPFQRIEVQRHSLADDVLLRILPKLENKIVPVLQHISDDSKRANFAYSRGIDLKWLRRRSLVYMYESPFWTIDERFIEDYLFYNYDDGWRTPKPNSQKPNQVSRKTKELKHV